MGKDGFARYKHLGEGSYQETERQIHDALRAAGASLCDVWASTAEEPQFDSEARNRDLDKRITREIYGGFPRNNSRAGLYVIQSEYYEGPGRVVD